MKQRVCPLEELRSELCNKSGKKKKGQEGREREGKRREGTGRKGGEGTSGKGQEGSLLDVIRTRRRETAGTEEERALQSAKSVK